MNKWLSGEWAIQKFDAQQRRVLHYQLMLSWIVVGFPVWLVLRDVIWFVGFMSLYAIWITHMTGWAAETPVEEET